MIYAIHAPNRLSADILLPASKSMSNRALMLGHLAGCHTIPLNIADCEDTRVLLNALTTPSENIDIRAAGTAMRFLTAYFAIGKGKKWLTGCPRICQRPIGDLVTALRKLGARIDYGLEEGFPPLRIEGAPLRGGKLTLPADVSSQFVSALLMIGPLLREGLTLHLEGDVVSRPYIDMTLKMMRRFGASAGWITSHMLRVDHAPYEPTTIRTEQDWSATAFWYEIAALCRDEKAEIRLDGMKENSVQGDEKVKDLFAPLGVGTTFTANGCVLNKTITDNKGFYQCDLRHAEPSLPHHWTAHPALQGM